WLFTLQDTIDISSSSPNLLVRIGTVRYQAPIYGVITIRVNRGQFIASDKTDYEFTMSRRTACRCHNDAAIAGMGECRHVSLYFISVDPTRWRKLDVKGLRYGPNSRELSNATRSGCVTKH